MSGDRRFLIVWRGRVIGPVAFARLRTLLASGKISADTQASLDGKVWARLGDIMNTLGETAGERRSEGGTDRIVPHVALANRVGLSRAEVNGGVIPPPLPQREHRSWGGRQEFPSEVWLILAAVGAFSVTLFLIGLLMWRPGEVAKRADVESPRSGAPLPENLDDSSDVAVEGLDPFSEALLDDLDGQSENIGVNPGTEPGEEIVTNPFFGARGNQSRQTFQAGGASKADDIGRSRDELGSPPANLVGGRGSSQPPARGGPQVWLAAVRDATVVIFTDKGQGSGFFVESPRGPVVVTDYHVIEGSYQIVIRCHNNQMHPVTHCQIFPEVDLAFLSVAGLKRVPATLVLRNGLPDLAEECYVYGAPLGLSDSITRGIVSAIRLTSECLPGEKFAEAKWVQTDAPLSSGNSGGPILDATGQVIGVSSFTLAPSGAQNLNFGLACTEIQARLKNLQLISFEDVLAAQLQVVAEGRQTLVYWSRLAALNRQFGELLEALEQQANNSPESSLAGLLILRECATAAAAIITQIDHTGVAPEAVNAGKTLQVFFVAVREAADACIAADQAWTVSQQRQIQARADRALKTLIEAAAMLEATRVTLSQRYGVEFPTLFGDDGS